MRRMYTTEGIQKIIDDSIDDAFKNIKDEEIGPGLFEKIKDNDEHDRFIEGSGDVGIFTGFNATYHKWSLSGTHLMCVLAGTLEAGNSLPSYQPLVSFTLPSWVRAKIYPVASDVIKSQTLTLMKTDNNEFYIETTAKAIFSALVNTNIVNLRLTEALASVDYNRAFRIQLDLIIDNE